MSPQLADQWWHFTPAYPLFALLVLKSHCLSSATSSRLGEKRKGRSPREAQPADTDPQQDMQLSHPTTSDVLFFATVLHSVYSATSVAWAPYQLNDYPPTWQAHNFPEGQICFKEFRSCCFKSTFLAIQLQHFIYLQDQPGSHGEELPSCHTTFGRQPPWF